MRKFVNARSLEDLTAVTEQRSHLVDRFTGYLHQRWNDDERNATQLFREIQQQGRPVLGRRGRSVNKLVAQRLTAGSPRSGVSRADRACGSGQPGDRCLRENVSEWKVLRSTNGAARIKTWENTTQ
ncbi:hypothetical protein ACVCAH_24475 [Micromonospora sp. LZ34]